MDLPGTNHVEYLAEYEQIEHYSEVSGRSHVLKMVVKVRAIEVFHHAGEHVLSIPVSHCGVLVRQNLLLSDVFVWLLRDKLRTSEHENEKNYGLIE